MGLAFQYTYLLWLLVLLPMLILLFFYALHKKKIVIKKLGDVKLIKELTKHHSPIAYTKKFIFIFFALAAILLSIINLRQQNKSEKTKKNGIDVMIALDVSKSMLAQDVQPNRLDRAKQLLNILIDKLDNDRVGITIFAGKAYLQMPLTTDHSAAKMYLASANTQTIPTQGTVIADALKICNASFNTTNKKYKAIVLISDGEEHEQNAVEEATLMANEGIVINTIGIGTTAGTQIIDDLTAQPKIDKDGNTVITKLNEELLKQIAQNGNGIYATYTSSEAVASKIANALSTLDKRTIDDESTFKYKSLFQYLLGIAFLLLFIETFLSETKKNSKKFALFFYFVFGFTPTFAQTDKANLTNGNKAYQNKEYELAIKKYNKVIEKNPKNYIAQNNIGNALHKLQNGEAAIKAFEIAAENSKNNIDKSNSIYNKGVVLQSQNKLYDCINSYKEALKINANNEDARHNLQLALKQQKKEQQNEEKKKNEKQGKNPKNENQPQLTEKRKSNITPKDAAQKLEALLQNEKKLQNKMHKSNAAAPNKQDKDW